MLRYVVLIVCLCHLRIAISFERKNGNIEFGKHGHSDILLDTQTIGTQGLSLWSLIKAPSMKYYNYKPNITESTPKITAIIIVDKRNDLPNADTAEVRIINGGIGEKEISLLFISKVGFGFNYEVSVYGEKKSFRERLKALWSRK